MNIAVQFIEAGCIGKEMFGAIIGNIVHYAAYTRRKNFQRKAIQDMPARHIYIISWQRHITFERKYMGRVAFFKYKWVFIWRKRLRAKDALEARCIASLLFQMQIHVSLVFWLEKDGQPHRLHQLSQKIIILAVCNLGKIVAVVYKELKGRKWGHFPQLSVLGLVFAILIVL